MDVFSIANNHRFDCGLQGPLETSNWLSGAGILPIGISPAPVLRKINGLDLALFAFDDVSAALDVEAAAQSIREAREQGAMVIVSIHWGAEYQAGASPRQEEIAGQFATAGASLVWGHHPHVLQPVAWIDSTLVFYSLGNALFDQGGLEDTRRSALLLVSLDEDGVGAVQSIPFEIDMIHSRLVKPDENATRQINSRLELP